MWVKINVLVAPPIAQGTGCARAGRHCPQDQTSVARYDGTTGRRQAAKGSAVSCQAPLPTDVSLNISSRLSPVMKMRRMPSGLLTRKCPLLMRRLSVLRLTPRACAASCREYTAKGSMAILSLTLDLLPGSVILSQARTRPKTCNGRECDTGRRACQGKPVVNIRADEGREGAATDRRRLALAIPPGRRHTGAQQPRRRQFVVQASPGSQGPPTASPGRRATAEFPPELTGERPAQGSVACSARRR